MDSTALIVAGGVLVIFAWLKFIKTGQVFKRKANLEGKTVPVTGGSYGIGKETAIQLAKHKARVIIASRNEDKGAEAVFDIRCQSGHDMVHFMKLDLSDFSSVRKIAKKILATEPRLDILVNNAGVAKRGKTKDGNDVILATNHLGPFLLTNLLMPLLKRTAESSPVRIVNVSGLAYLAGKIDFENINLGLEESCAFIQIAKQYCNTKLMNIYFTSELHRRLCVDDPQCAKISTFSLHPGIISSKFGMELTQANPATRFGHKFLRVIMTRSPFYGCQTILYCCLQEGLESKSGRYFCNLKEEKLATHAADASIAEKLWELSVKMTNI